MPDNDDRLRRVQKTLRCGHPGKSGGTARGAETRQDCMPEIQTPPGEEMAFAPALPQVRGQDATGRINHSLGLRHRTRVSRLGLISWEAVQNLSKITDGMVLA